MVGKLKIFVLMVIGIVVGHVAMAQSFMYIQSENGTPFYIKMNDSLLSSTHSGYLVLNQLGKGTYPMIIGFAKKKIPEAAFKITLDESGDKGYLLRSIGGKLQLVNIQNNKILQPAEVATSAGNRILPSTIAGMGEQSEEQKADQPFADETVASTPDDKPVEEQASEPENNPFETMLNAVTGSKTPSAPVAEKQETEQKAPPVEEPPVTAEVSVPEEETPVPEEKEPSFFDLLNPDANTSAKEKQEPEPATLPETTKPETPSPPANAASDLTFIDFSSVADNAKDQTQNIEQHNARKDENLYNDTIITSGKELRRMQQRREAGQKNEQSANGSLFDRLLKKVDTTVADSAGSRSVAKPLLGDNNTRQEERAASENALCNEIADEQYFNKVLRKIASKKSEEAMLRAANRYLSDEKCYTVPQIKRLAYLFPSDAFRLQFLKTAYLHCSEKDAYGSLIGTLSSEHYQNRLKDYIR